MLRDGTAVEADGLLERSERVGPQRHWFGSAPTCSAAWPRSPMCPQSARSTACPRSPTFPPVPNVRAVPNVSPIGSGMQVVFGMGW